MSRPTGLLLINDFHVLINGAYTMRGRGVRFLPSPRPFPIFSLRVEAGNAPRMRVEGTFFFLSFLPRTRVFPARGERATRVRARLLSGRRKKEEAGGCIASSRILSGPFRGTFRLKSDLCGSIINLG